MRLGITWWTYPWAIGVNGHPPPVRPIRLADLLERAATLRVSVVQIADNLPLHKLDSEELRDVRDQAAGLGIKIEIGTRGVEPDHLLLYLSLALKLEAVLVRTLTYAFKSQPSLELAEQWIREVLRSLSRTELRLAWRITRSIPASLSQV